MTLAKQLDRLSIPLLLAAFIAAFGLLCLCLRCYRLSAGLLAVAVFWLWLCCAPAFAIWLQRGLESQYPQQPAASYAKADAIVVLGGGVVPRSDLLWVDNASIEATRIGFGLQLFQRSRADTVLLSGGDGEALRMAQKLREQDVPTSALQMETASSNTYENALYSAALLKSEKRLRILLVTSPMHMRRAAACFRKQGLTVIPAPTSAPVPDSHFSGHPWWPKRRALVLSNRSLREYLGLWAYKLLGWA